MVRIATLLKHSDNLVVDWRIVAVLVICGTTRITEHYPVVGRIGLSMTGLALCSK